MFFRQLLNDETACASYLLGCKSRGEMAVVDPHADPRLLALPDDLLLYPAHYSGSVCGRGLSGNPASTVGFERRHNPALQLSSEGEFVAALTREIPPAPEEQAAIVAANRSGRPLAGKT